MKYYLSLLILLFTNSQQAFSALPVLLPFKCIDNRIIVRVATSKGDTLNFLFDTGSDIFLIDSASVADHGLAKHYEGKIPIPLLAGTLLQGTVFQNQSMFRDPGINLIYNTLIAIDAKKIPNMPGIPIHGIMGVNHFMQRYIIRIDFESQTIGLVDGNEAILNEKKTLVIPMIYTDKDHETHLSKYARLLPATLARVYISRGNLITTNALFDTGIRFDFLLFTCLQTDSLLRCWGKSNAYDSTPDSAFTIEKGRYAFTGDSLKIGGNIFETTTSIQLAQTSVPGLVDFGDLQTVLDIGVAYLKKYKTIDFDYPGKRICLTSY